MNVEETISNFNKLIRYAKFVIAESAQIEGRKCNIDDLNYTETELTRGLVFEGYVSCGKGCCSEYDTEEIALNDLQRCWDDEGAYFSKLRSEVETRKITEIERQRAEKAENEYQAQRLAAWMQSPDYQKFLELSQKNKEMQGFK